MNIKTNKIQLDRTVYKQIKSMDKDKMSDFLSNIYMSGKNDAESDAVDFDGLKAEIGKIKGVGEARLSEIMSVIEKFMSR